jgi:hypothetical protein
LADELERPGEEPEQHDAEPHLPSPTILPFAFAAGVALVLVGLIINWWLAVAGGVLALVFGFAWIREATKDVRARPEPEPAPAAEISELAEDEEDEEPERYPRAVFLELSTLGIGAAIGGLVTVPALGFMIAPAFVGQGDDDLGRERLGLPVPVPRRRLRRGGQPHRRPACARARPLRVHDQEREPRPREALQRRQGHRAGR